MALDRRAAVARGPTSPDPEQRRAGGSLLPLLLILGLCVELRLFRLGHLSLWTDEIFSRYYYDLLGPGFLFTEGLRIEPNFPLYYVLLHGWMALAGTGEYALRAFSVLAAAAALPLIYLLALDLGSRRQALAAAGLYAICPFAIYFAQETRVYAMTLAPACLVLLGAARFLGGAPARRWAAPYVAGATLCLYLHATLVLLVASCGAAVAAHLLATRRPGLLRGLARWTGANAAALVLAAPAIYAMAVAARSGSLDWVPPLSARDVAFGVAALLGGMVTPFPNPGFWLAAILGLALAGSVWACRPDRRTLAILVLIPCGFVALAVLLSLSRPIFLPRVLCWLVVPLCVLTGHLLLRPFRLRPVLAAATALVFATGLTWQLAFSDAAKEPWRDALPTLRPELQGADLVVLSPRFDPLILDYYGPGLRNARMWDEPLPATVMTYVSAKLGLASVSRAEIIRSIAAGRTVWVLSNAPDLPFLAELAAAVRAPSGEKQWLCGRSPCITAVGWGPAPAQAGVADGPARRG